MKRRGEHMLRAKLKKVRLENHMTLEQVAKEIHVSTPFYWQIENGKRGLSYELAVKNCSCVFNET